MPCPAPQKPHTPTRPTAVSRFNRLPIPRTASNPLPNGQMALGNGSRDIDATAEIDDVAGREQEIYLETQAVPVIAAEVIDKGRRSRIEVIYFAAVATRVYSGFRMIRRGSSIHRVHSLRVTRWNT